MNILVCFKAVPDLDMLSNEDWVVDKDLNIDVSFVRNNLNCFDESALEMVLKLSEKSEGFNTFVNLTALTIGDNNCDMYLKTLYALRFEKTVRIDSKEDIRFKPEVVASVISQYVNKMNTQDVVILGKQSGIGDNAKTPLLVAEMLEWPCITNVINLEPNTSDTIKVTNLVDGGTLTQIVKTPCILSVGNAPNSYLRVQTLKDKMKYGKKPIEIIDIEEFNIQSDNAQCYNECILTGLEKINNERKSIIIDGETQSEKATKLYFSYLKERLEKL